MKVLIFALLLLGFVFGSVLEVVASDIESENHFPALTEQSQEETREQILCWLDELIAGMEKDAVYLIEIREFRKMVDGAEIVLLEAEAPLSGCSYFFDSQGTPYLRALHINHEIFGLLIEGGERDRRYRAILESNLVFHGVRLKSLGDNKDLIRKEQERVREYQSLLARRWEGERVEPNLIVRCAQKIVAFEIHLEYLPQKERLLYLYAHGLDAGAIRELAEQETNYVLRSYLEDLSFGVEKWVNKKGEVEEGRIKPYLFESYASDLDRRISGVTGMALGKSKSLNFLLDENVYNLGVHPFMRFLEGLWFNFIIMLYPHVRVIGVVCYVLAAIFVFFAILPVASLAWERAKPAQRLKIAYIKLQLGRRDIELIKKRPFSPNELSLLWEIIRSDEKGEGELIKSLKKVVEETGSPLPLERENAFRRWTIESRVSSGGEVRLTFFNGFFALRQEGARRVFIEATNVYLEKVKETAERAVLPPPSPGEISVGYVPRKRGSIALRPVRSQGSNEKEVDPSTPKPIELTFKDFLLRRLKQGRIGEAQYNYFINKEGDGIEERVATFRRVARRLYSGSRTSKKESQWGLFRQLILQMLGDKTALEDLLGANLLMEPSKEDLRLTDEGACIYGWWLPEIKERVRENLQENH